MGKLLFIHAVHELLVQLISVVEVVSGIYLMFVPLVFNMSSIINKMFPNNILEVYIYGWFPIQIHGKNNVFCREAVRASRL